MELPPDILPTRVRSFVRRGRRSSLTLERIERLGPAWSLPEGPFDPALTFGRVAPVVLEIGCGHTDLHHPSGEVACYPCDEHHPW